eukprot:jgi/Botrbrau1/22596/Bobra.176_1s0026.1
MHAHSRAHAYYLVMRRRFMHVLHLHDCESGLRVDSQYNNAKFCGLTTPSCIDTHTAKSVRHQH